MGGSKACRIGFVSVVVALLAAGCTSSPPGESGGTPGCPDGTSVTVSRSSSQSLDSARAVSPGGEFVVTTRRGAGNVWKVVAWATSSTPAAVGTLDYPGNEFPLAPRVEVADDGIVYLAVTTSAHPFGLRWDPSTGAVSEPTEPTVTVPPGTESSTVTLSGPTGGGERLVWLQEYFPTGPSGYLNGRTRAMETDNRTDAVVAVQDLTPFPGNPDTRLATGSEDGRFVLQYASQDDQFLPEYGRVDAQVIDMVTGVEVSLDGATDVIPNQQPGWSPNGGLWPQSVSSSGRYVLFVQERASLTANAGLYLWDVQTSTSTVVTGALASFQQDDGIRQASVDDDGVVTYLRLDAQIPSTAATYKVIAWDVATAQSRTIRTFVSPGALPALAPFVDLSAEGSSIVLTEVDRQPASDSAVTLVRCG